MRSFVAPFPTGPRLDCCSGALRRHGAGARVEPPARTYPIQGSSAESGVRVPARVAGMGLEGVAGFAGWWAAQSARPVGSCRVRLSMYILDLRLA